MKKTLFSLFTAVSLALLYCPAAFALTEDEAAAAVDAQGKDAVSGNLFLWLLCAIAFLKVSTKLDGILHSLGIGVSRSPGSMLSEALLASYYKVVVIKVPLQGQNATIDKVLWIGLNLLPQDGFGKAPTTALCF